MEKWATIVRTSTKNCPQFASIISKCNLQVSLQGRDIEICWQARMGNKLYPATRNVVTVDKKFDGKAGAYDPGNRLEWSFRKWWVTTINVTDLFCRKYIIISWGQQIQIINHIQAQMPSASSKTWPFLLSRPESTRELVEEEKQHWASDTTTSLNRLQDTFMQHI